MNLPKLLKPMRTYLSGPRIVFSGRFLADPSTVNNYPDNFRKARELSTADFKTQVLDKPEKAGWNPYGTGAWSLLKCQVTGANRKNGEVITKDDRIIGAAIKPSERSTEGKIVDLDPQNQMVSQLWGFKVRATDSNLNNLLSGSYKPTAFRNIWGRVDGLKPNMTTSSAYYHSILEKVEVDSTDSPILQELKNAAKESGTNALSIRFTVDGFSFKPNDIEDKTGRIIGTIGQFYPPNPYSFALSRHLFPSDRNFPTMDAPAELYESEPNVYKLTIDLSNSLQASSVAGPLTNKYGELYLAYKDEKNGFQPVGDAIPYSGPNWLATTGGIHTATIDASDASKIAKSVVAVVRKENGKYMPILSETQAPGLEGVSVRAENFVFRLNYKETASVKLVATKFGQPYPNAKIKVEQSALLKSAMELTTDSEGAASFNITNQGNHQKRRYIDGQLYNLRYYMENAGNQIPANTGDQSYLIDVLAWDDYKIPDIPTWKEHIQPIFQQYSNLYPIMQKMLDLSDYRSVTSNLESLKHAFSTDISSAHYMPATRDLSQNKRDMILKWLDRPVYEKAGSGGGTIQDLPHLKEMLQEAIVLELATIPVYLSALYSIKLGTNVEIANLLRSIVMEEMLHALLASNVLNAIGGSPNLSSPQMIPSYPDYLPEGIINRTIITLGPLTKERVKGVFMEIEQPDEIGTVAKDIQGRLSFVQPPTVSALAAMASTSDPDNFTIGDFYTGIKEALKRLTKEDPTIFGKNAQEKEERAKKQIKTWGRDEVGVTDLETALSAIDKIILQGEGTSRSNPSNDHESFAHYYKFWEIYEGKRLKASADKRYDYVFGEKDYPLDQENIYPMYEYKIKGEELEPGYAKDLSDQFNEMYARLMLALHDLFNGKPEKFGDAVGIMRNLETKARQLMEIEMPGHPGKTVGTNFNCRPFLKPEQQKVEPVRTEERVLRATPLTARVAAHADSLFSAPGMKKFKQNRAKELRERKEKIEEAEKPKSASPLTFSKVSDEGSIPPHKHVTESELKGEK